MHLNLSRPAPTKHQQSTLMRAFLVLAALATSSALKVADPATKVATKVPAAKLPSSAASALALRGGGVVSGSVWLKSFSAFMGMYAVGFVLAPAMVIEQNFDTPYDKYHLFISRLSGIAFLFRT